MNEINEQNLIQMSTDAVAGKVTVEQARAHLAHCLENAQQLALLSQVVAVNLQHAQDLMLVAIAQHAGNEA